MKRLTYILTLLLVSVVTTACINNFAVQELNNNAKIYMDKGDVDSAICRLKSSLELDKEVWETHYNLGSAYLNIEKFDESIAEYEKAAKLNPTAEPCYALAVAYETYANSLEKQLQEEDKKVDEKFIQKIVPLLTQAIDNYSKYLEMAEISESENNEIQTRLESLNALVESYQANDVVEQ